MFFYDPRNVIYNIYTPNENECINEPKETMPDVYEDLDFHFFSGRDWGNGPQPFRNSYNSGSVWGRRSGFNPFSDFPHESSNRFRFQRPLETNPVVTQRSSNFVPNDEITEKLKKYCGSTLYVKDLKRVGKLLEKRIHIHFPTSVKKSLMLGWYAHNWDQIEPIIDEVTQK